MIQFKFSVHNRRTDEVRVIENIPDDRVLVFETYRKNATFGVEEQSFE